MPKMPGRKSTKFTAKVEDLVIGSFIMDSETWAWRWVCCVKDCDHRMGPDPQNLRDTLVGCDPNHLPAHAAFDREGFPSAGVVCSHHVGEILART